MEIEVYILDTFTKTPFNGNPAAICLLNTEIDSPTLQRIAQEFNYPVTAFVRPVNSSKDQYTICYFTVTTEIHACGHATLGASAVLFEREQWTEMVFQTGDGALLKTTVQEGLVTMEYPALALLPREVDRTLLNSLGLASCRWSGYSRQLASLFVEIDEPSVLKSLAPDFKKMVHSAPAGVQEIVVMSVADDSRFDFLLRSFCPWIGINEDPATGSVHAALGGYWKQKTGRSVLNVCQASRRGGEISLLVTDKSVFISGYCSILLRGQLQL